MPHPELAHVSEVTPGKMGPMFYEKARARKATRRNLCGAPLTEWDVSLSDARKLAGAGTLDTWVGCTACRERVR